MTIDDQEYDVVFDGVHGGADWDLLCCPEVREKRPGGSVRRVEMNWLPQNHAVRPTRTDALYTTIRACLERQPSTVYELCTATGFYAVRVRTVIVAMRKQGLLDGRVVPRAERVHGWRRYHWKGAPVGPLTAETLTFSAAPSGIAKVSARAQRDPATPADRTAP